MSSDHSITKRASDITEKTIGGMILSMDLPPGVVFTEVELVRRLGCGRTPLREALQRLSTQYLVDIVPRQGIRIAEMDLVDYVKLIDALALLEGNSARIAAELITQEEIIQLEGMLEQEGALVKWGDALALAELDYQFHLAIAQAARNKYLADAIHRLRLLAARYIFLAFKNGASSEESIREHRQVLALLTCHSPAEAEQATVSHVYHVKEQILNSF